MVGREEDALYYLRNGEFEKAKSIFSQLLDESPENPSWREGFFLSSYWDNKLDYLLSQREGKERGKALLEYLNSFDETIKERSYPKSKSYEATISCILEEISYHLGIAFRLEGWNGLDWKTLYGLAATYIRLSHYKQAMELLEYGLGEKTLQIEFEFLRAECLIGLNRIQEGKDLYMRCFLEDPYKYRPDTTKWKAIATINRELEGLSQEFNPDLLLPIWLWERGELQTNITADYQDLLNWTSLMERMNQALETHTGKYKSNTKLRLYYIAAVLLGKFPERNFPQEVGLAKGIYHSMKKELSALLPE